MLAWLVPHETAAVSAHVLCTPYNRAPCHFMQSHIRKVYACLAVTSHLHFWQNDRDRLGATAVTRGWNGYRNKSQHRKSTLEKKILPLFLQGFEPVTFQSWVRCSNHWAIAATEHATIRSKDCNTFCIFIKLSQTMISESYNHLWGYLGHQRLLLLEQPCHKLLQVVKVLLVSK